MSRLYRFEDCILLEMVVRESLKLPPLILPVLHSALPMAPSPAFRAKSLVMNLA